MATLEELRTACKIGLNIQTDSTAFNSVLDQKINLVQGYMLGAGVSQEQLDTEMGISVLALGVGDSWNLSAGETKFSTAFHALLTQLTAASRLLTFTTTPTDGAIGVVVDVKPMLMFNKRLAGYTVQLKEYDSQVDVPFTAALDITEKVITITLGSNLVTATKYALVVEATSTDGPSLARTVISFTTD